MLLPTNTFPVENTVPSLSVTIADEPVALMTALEDIVLRCQTLSWGGRQGGRVSDGDDTSKASARCSVEIVDDSRGNEACKDCRTIFLGETLRDGHIVDLGDAAGDCNRSTMASRGMV